MKARFYSFPSLGFLAAVIALTGTAGYCGQPERSQTPLPTTPGTNAIPRSVFVRPTSKAEGRDPFYPNSPLDHGKGTMTVQPQQDAPPVTLVLNALSAGFAGINGYTLAPGEEANVRTPSGARVRVKLLEIKERSAVVLIEGKQQQELQLRPGN